MIRQPNHAHRVGVRHRLREHAFGAVIVVLWAGLIVGLLAVR